MIQPKKKLTCFIRKTVERTMKSYRIKNHTKSIYDDYLEYYDTLTRSEGYAELDRLKNNNPHLYQLITERYETKKEI